jgi:hypothetical protein
VCEYLVSYTIGATATAGCSSLLVSATQTNNVTKEGGRRERKKE